MPLGKTIRLYLIDGSATGPIAAEIINWTGQVVLVPRSELHELAGREQLRGTGIYILVGPSEHGDTDRVYLCEADSVYWRLKEHDRAPNGEKDFWTRAVAVTSKDTNLTKAHGRYLESRLIEMGHDAARATLENAPTPSWQHHRRQRKKGSPRGFGVVFGATREVTKQRPRSRRDFVKPWPPFAAPRS